jgi:hypothetical protein
MFKTLDPKQSQSDASFNPKMSSMKKGDTKLPPISRKPTKVEGGNVKQITRNSNGSKAMFGSKSINLLKSL